MIQLGKQLDKLNQRIKDLEAKRKPLAEREEARDALKKAKELYAKTFKRGKK